MASGSLDPQNVWQYGEDDTASSFSGLMAKLTGPLSTKIAALAASIANLVTQVGARVIAQTAGDSTRYGSVIVTVNASGQATVTLATPFAAISRTVVASLGDGAGYAYVIAFNPANLTNFTVQVRLVGGAAAASGSYRINYVAVGQ